MSESKLITTDYFHQQYSTEIQSVCTHVDVVVSFNFTLDTIWHFPFLGAWLP